jgi:hypothetical protein
LQKTCDEHLRAPKDGYWRHKEPVVGKVTKIWPNNLYPEDFDWDPPDAIPPIIGVAPERDWQVSVAIKKRPSWWPYPDVDVFCPEVKYLTSIK